MEGQRRIEFRPRNVLHKRIGGHDVYCARGL